MDSQKNRAEIDQLLAQIEANLHRDDAGALYENMRALNECTIYSNCQAYERWKALKFDVVRCLFQGLPFSQFLKTPTGSNLDKFDIARGLDGVAHAMTLEQIFSLAEHIESLPGEQDTPHLFRRLVESPEEAVTLRLRRWIEDRLPTEQAQGTALSSHLKLISTFTLRWMPDDKGLSGAVKILCRRNDDWARQWTAEYLSTLPWGQDRLATKVLLSELAEAKTPYHRQLLQQALAQYTTPSALRLMLLSAYGSYDVAEALEIGLQDLKEIQSEEGQESYLDWLWNTSGPAANEEAALYERLEPRINELDLGAWSSLTRGYLAALLRTRFPTCKLPKEIRRTDRWAVGIVRLFHAIRIEHMSCGLYLVIIVGIAVLYLWILNHTLGALPKPFALLDRILLLIWILVASGTMHTHFSGGESLHSHFRMAVSLFTAILCFVVGTILLRLWLH